ncbi:Wzz/FepE/Etk N-terminal domain-containing protein [Actinomyces sp. oral taxon 897]|jgi:hypothetical protein|uniref:Wzz/FepE/Etk N-terminal domain-containing protein n=1 Tax=Actinomyces sp. oral taxon 897 TaxID=2081702 RepID=UPI000D042DFD|nr:Wzz/FepE/Etk N-terminal domain-containing protein [Actinomyces sp. oral taxon 897]AVM62083.1 hypothetical protein C3V41_08490 [Actinomyces sp. oral taxon 897]
MEPDRILAALRKHIILVTAHALMGALLGFGLGSFLPRQYTSTTSVLVYTSQNDGSQGLTGSAALTSTIMPTLIELGNSRSVAAEVARSTGADPGRVAGAISLTNPVGTLLIEIRATATAADLAHDLAAAEVDALGKRVGKMSLKAGEDNSPLALTSVDDPTVPTHSGGTSRLTTAFLGLAAGLLIGAGFAVGLDARATRRAVASLSAPGRS